MLEETCFGMGSGVLGIQKKAVLGVDMRQEVSVSVGTPETYREAGMN